MEIKRYKSELKKEWDKFVRHSKNGTFLLCRDFIEYHGDRFDDHSLLFYDNEGKLLTLIAGNISETTYYSHQGLTYGGLILSEETTATQVLEIFSVLKDYLKSLEMNDFIYKAIPHIYHQIPAEEDLYALFRLDAELIQRNISSTILLPNQIEYSKTRKRGLEKAQKENLNIGIDTDLSAFWELLSSNLKERYETKPIHSLEEISHLKNCFPNEIKLYSSRNDMGGMIAGCLTFEMENVCHAQYTASNDEGKKNGGVDAVIDFIINNCNKKYFDYGTSINPNTQELNPNLIYHKEGFGARGIIYDTYHIKI